MGTGKQRFFIESSARLKNGLLDGVIEKAGLSGKFRRISLGVRTMQGEQVRIDFEIEPLDSSVRAANIKQFDRLISVLNLPSVRDTKEFVGRRVGLRIHRGQFLQFESPLRSEVAQ
jgi:hypothetical protein